MLLYKYLAPERLDVLRGRLIRFTQPLVFNDPFESKPHLFDDYTAAEWRRIGEMETKSMGLDPALVDQILSPDAFAKRRPIAFQILLDLLRTSVGVLSLSEEPASLLMWAHYASNHTGYVIGFDSSHPFFGPEGERQSRVNELCKVRYSQARPSRSLRNLSLIDTYFTKSRDEREWRIFKGLQSADRVIEAEIPVCLFRVPEEAVVSVIVGCRASEDTRKAISRTLADKSYAHVQYLRADLDNGRFRLNVFPVDIVTVTAEQSLPPDARKTHVAEGKRSAKREEE